jgi:DNA-binding NtrC family response regulator
MEIVGRPFHEAKERFESVYFKALIARSEGKKSRAAELAGLDRTTLYSYLRKLGLGGE